MKLLLLVAVVVLPFTGFAQEAPKKKTQAEYWTETGLSTQLLVNSGFLAEQDCYQNKNQFRGCFYALRNLLEFSEKKLELLPSQLVSDKVFLVDKVEQEFDAITLVSLKPIDLKKIKAATVPAMQREAQAKLNSALEALYFGRRFGGKTVDFLALYNELITKTTAHKIPSISTPSDLNAFAAARMFSGYLMESMNDAHARIESVAYFNSLMNSAGEQFVGIGAVLKQGEGKVLVNKIVPGGPAASSALRKDDEIVSVDGDSSVAGKVDLVVNKVRGKPNTTAVLKVKRAGIEGEIEIAIPRGAVRVENVTASVVEDLGKKFGYIRIDTFVDNNACASLQQRIKDLEAEKVEGLILDVRSNGGGLVDQAVCMGGFFVGQKVITKVMNLDDGTMLEHVSENKVLTKLPMVVLIDGGSASASELLAGALQDYRRAWLLGDRSFGKGTAQANGESPLNMPGIQMFKTIQRFYQPTGRTNQVVGLTPDFDVPAEPEVAEEDRLVMREGDLFPSALSALGEPWVQPRPTKVKEIDECAKSFDLAAKKYKLDAGSKDAVDYQVYAAEEVLSCAVKK